MNRDDPDFVPSILSYRKKNQNQSQMLKRFRRIENRRRHPESTRKTHKDKHENISKNTDITFEVKNIEPTHTKWKSLDNLENQELLVFVSAGIRIFSSETNTESYK